MRTRQEVVTRQLKEVQAGIDQLAARGFLSAQDAYRKGTLQPIMDALKKADSHGEFLASTHDLVDQMDPQPIADALAETTFVASLIGRISATPVALKNPQREAP